MKFSLRNVSQWLKNQSTVEPLFSPFSRNWEKGVVLKPWQSKHRDFPPPPSPSRAVPSFSEYQRTGFPFSEQTCKANRRAHLHTYTHTHIVSASHMHTRVKITPHPTPLHSAASCFWLGSRACKWGEEQAGRSHVQAAGARCPGSGLRRVALCHSDTLPGPVESERHCGQHHGYSPCLLGWGVAGMGSLGLGPRWQPTLLLLPVSHVSFWKFSNVASPHHGSHRSRGFCFGDRSGGGCVVP